MELTKEERQKLVNAFKNAAKRQLSVCGLVC